MHGCDWYLNISTTVHQILLMVPLANVVLIGIFVTWIPNAAFAIGECPANSEPIPGSSTAMCQCSAGFTGSDGEPCTACGVGMYKAVPGSATCTVCGAGTYANTGSSGCTICPPNSYCSDGVRFECSEYEVSAEGSGEDSACTCMHGYFS